MNKKICKKCGVEKSVSEFYKNSDMKDNLHGKCKACFLEYNQKYFQNPKNRKKAIEYQAEYFQNVRKEYRKTPGERARRNAYEKLSRQSNPKLKLRDKMSGAIRSSLVNGKEGKGWQELVGYSLADLTSHLEKQFTSEMNWKNYRTYWVIDHIIPECWYKYETASDLGFKLCWSLENFQPLTIKANSKKSDFRGFINKLKKV